jgi:hypothetical protein
MYFTGQNVTHIATVFGSGYMPEQHQDESRRYLPVPAKREPLMNFDELLKKLRAALSLG